MVPRLHLYQADIQMMPGNRGRLLSAREVADEIFRGHVSDRWVRMNVPEKVALGHSKVMWYEDDVRAWIEKRKVA